MSLRDKQKVFGVLSTAITQPAVTFTAEPSGIMSVDLISAPSEPSLPVSTSDHSLSLEDISVQLLDQVQQRCPDIIPTLELLFDGLFGRIKSTEQAITAPTAPKTFAAAILSQPKRSFSTEFRKKLASTNSTIEKTKLLADSWEARSRANNRLCADPSSGIHMMTQENESFTVVHLAGFDLMRDEPRATISAVLKEKFGLPSSVIINVSPIAPKLQELHIISSKLPELKAAVNRSNVALQLSTRLDASRPGVDSTDDTAIADSKAKFSARLDREITRLPSSPACRLKDMAEFLVDYKLHGTRQSSSSSPIHHICLSFYR